MAAAGGVYFNPINRFASTVGRMVAYRIIDARIAGVVRRQRSIHVDAACEPAFGDNAPMVGPQKGP